MTLQHNFKMPLSMAKRQGRRLMGVAVLLLFSAVAQAQPMSGTYTVCSGTSCNYSSVTAAVDDLNSRGVSGPVVIDIAQGTYTEKFISIGNSTSGVSGVSATNTITIKGAGRSKTTITESVSNWGDYIFRVYYTGHVIIKDLDIYNSVSFTGYNEVYTLYLYYSDNCKITKCLIRNQDGDTWDDYGQIPIYSDGCSMTLIANNWIRGGSYGMYHWGSGNSYYGDTIRDNRFTRSFDYALYRQYRYGDVVKNNIFDSTGTAVDSYEDNGSVFEGNYIMGNGQINGWSSYMYTGLSLGYPGEYYTATPLVVRNNFINNVFVGIDAYSYNTNYANFDVYHNTMVQRPDASQWDFLMRYYNGSYSYGYDIRNNIFHASSSGSGISIYNIDVSSGDIIDGNNYVISSGSVAEISWNLYSTLNDVRTGFPGVEDHGSTSAITFKATGDLHLDQSAAAPSAPYVGVDKDVDGDSRCQLFPTVGADENNFGKGPVKAKFFAPNVVYDSSPATFYNIAKEGEPKVHRWYIDGVFVTGDVNLQTTLTGSSHTIALATEGCGGYDSTSQSITVTIPATTPSSNFVASQNQFLQGGSTKFTDLSDLGPISWTWDITPVTITTGSGSSNRYAYINGTTKNSQNPEVRFMHPGKYKVCLTASNVKGAGTAECKVDYIDVIPAINFETTGFTRVKDAAGYLYDDGGPNGNYVSTGNPRTAFMLLDPCASEVSLVIDKFSIESGYDYLRIYDGADKATAIPLHEMRGCSSNMGWDNQGPGFTGPAYSSTYDCIPSSNDTFVAKSGKMLIEFYVDYYTESDGFEMHYWSTPKIVSPPVASFISDTTVCQNGLLTFTNTSTGEDNEYYWDLDNDMTTFEAQDKDETLWLFTIPGPQKVTLIAENCGGFDTFTQVIDVFVPSKPTISFEADNLNPTTTDVVFMSSMIPECVDDYQWTFTHSSGTAQFVNGTTKFTDNPQLVLPATGCWTVTLKATNMGGDNTLTKTCYINVKDAYCAPSAANLIADVGIAEVAIMAADSTDLMRNSTDQAVKDYTSYVNDSKLATSVEIGVSYFLEVKRNSAANGVTRTAWIDWNLDGDFDDPAEEIGEEVNSSAKDWVQSFTIPIIAKTGATVMRVATNLGAYSNEVCGQNRFGEYEDYRLYISDDKTAPVITMYNAKGGAVKAGDTLYIEQGRTYTEYGYKAIDNLDGDITLDVTTDTINVANNQVGDLNTFVVRVYAVRYNVQDASGNPAKTAMRIVKILKDTTPPTLVIAQPEVVNWDVDKASTFKMPVMTKVDDIVDGISVTLDTLVYNNGVLVPAVDPMVVDTYEVHYTAADEAGNKVVVIRTIIIEDITQPILSLIGPANIEHLVNTPYDDAGVNISDNYYDSALLASQYLQVTGTVDYTKLGVYQIIYTLTDPSGNGPVSVSRIIEVVDKTAPDVTYKANDTLIFDVHTTFVDPVFTVEDDYDKESDVITDRSGSLLSVLSEEERLMKLGTYEVIYDFTDLSGNVTSVPFTVEVVDREAPKVTLKGNSTVTICRWANYVDSNVTINDNYFVDSDDFKVETEGTFLTMGGSDIEGLYDLRYVVTDSSGNVGYSEYRRILVKSPDQYPCSLNGIEDNKALDQLIMVYPNPSSGIFTVNVMLETQRQLRISVMNLLGEEIAVVKEGQVMNGMYSLDLSQQASGVYLLKVQSGDTAFTKRLIVNK